MTYQTAIPRAFKGVASFSFALFFAAWIASLWFPLRMSKGGFMPRLSGGVVVWPILGPHKSPSRPTNFGFVLPKICRAPVVVQEEIDQAIAKGISANRKRKLWKEEVLRPLRLTGDQFGNPISASSPYSYGYAPSGVLTLVDIDDRYLGEGVFDSDRLHFTKVVGYTIRATAVEIPMWMPCGILSIFVLWLWHPNIAALVRKFRTPIGYCRGCGYNLTGNTSGRCPECGRVTDQQIVVT